MAYSEREREFTFANKTTSAVQPSLSVFLGDHLLNGSPYAIGPLSCLFERWRTVANGWMDQDETCRGGRPRLRPHCVRWGPSPIPKGDSPQFSAHVRCGQMVGWIKIPLGREVDLGPGHIVLDGDPALHPKKGHTSPPPTVFGPCLSWTNDWMDQDASWYGGTVLATLC